MTVSDENSKAEKHMEKDNLWNKVKELVRSSKNEPPPGSDWKLKVKELLHTYETPPAEKIKRGICDLYEYAEKGEVCFSIPELWPDSEVLVVAEGAPKNHVDWGFCIFFALEPLKEGRTSGEWFRNTLKETLAQETRISFINVFLCCGDPSHSKHQQRYERIFKDMIESFKNMIVLPQRLKILAAGKAAEAELGRWGIQSAYIWHPSFAKRWGKRDAYIQKINHAYRSA